MSTGGAEAKSFEGLMSSPWKVGLIRQDHGRRASWLSSGCLLTNTLFAVAPA